MICAYPISRVMYGGVHARSFSAIFLCSCDCVRLTLMISHNTRKRSSSVVAARVREHFCSGLQHSRVVLVAGNVSWVTQEIAVVDRSRSCSRRPLQQRIERELVMNKDVFSVEG